MGSKYVTSVFLLPLVIFYLDFHYFQDYRSENSPPQVTIVKPTEKTFKWNSWVPYSIRVSDKEDGESEYDEIPENEVFLEVRYFSSSALALEYRIEERIKDRAVLRMMSKSNCLSCHAARSKLIGPSFDSISHRYAELPQSVDILSEKIMNGTQGVWGDEPMPPQPELTREEVGQMVGWILELHANPDYVFYVGSEGSFKTREKIGSVDGAYLLTASYTDQGIEGKPKSGKEGLYTLILLKS